MVLLIDNYDSFTYNLRDYLAQLGQPTHVIRNDEKNLVEIASLPFDSILISPGPKTPAQAGLLLPLIATYENSKPILGICLGHQAIGQFYGAKLTKAVRPMHGKISTVQHQGHPLFKNIDRNFEAMRYHSLILENLPACLETTATTTDGELMALAHYEKKVAGVQFHPESVLTPTGLQLLQNWFNWITL